MLLVETKCSIFPWTYTVAIKCILFAGVFTLILDSICMRGFIYVHKMQICSLIFNGFFVVVVVRFSFNAGVCAIFQIWECEESLERDLLLCEAVGWKVYQVQAGPAMHTVGARTVVGVNRFLCLQPHAKNVLYSFLHARKNPHEADGEQVTATPPCLFCLCFYVLYYTGMTCLMLFIAVTCVLWGD